MALVREFSGGSRMGNKVNIYVIAKEAGVSVSTVSRVLTGNAPVKPETKRRVMDVIEKYDFRPNSLARSLLFKKSKMIGIVVPDISNPFFSTLVLQSEAFALKSGYTTFLCNSMNDHQLETTYLYNLLDKQVDGIIFVGGRINDSKTNPKYAEEMRDVMQRIPVVFVNGRMEGVDTHIVRTDEEAGIGKLVDLLVKYGHRDIGLLGGVSGISATDVKHQAFRKAMERHRLPIREDWILEDGFSIESGEKAASALMNQREHPTAVLCINDFVAIGAIKMFNKFGLRVPDDMSVAGFDDIYLAGDFPPGITTVSQNYVELGETAVRVLIDLIQKKEVEQETIIPTSLVVRESCRAL